MYKSCLSLRGWLTLVLSAVNLVCVNSPKVYTNPLTAGLVRQSVVYGVPFTRPTSHPSAFDLIARSSVDLMSLFAASPFENETVTTYNAVLDAPATKNPSPFTRSSRMILFLHHILHKSSAGCLGVLLIQLQNTKHKLVWGFFFLLLFIYVAFSGFGHCPLLALVFFPLSA